LASGAVRTCGRRPHRPQLADRAPIGRLGTHWSDGAVALLTIRPTAQRRLRRTTWRRRSASWHP